MPYMPPCHCCKASSVPYASLSLLQGIISALCLPVTAARHHQCPVPPYYKAHCCKASSVPYASLLQDSLLQAPLPAYLASVLCVIIAFIQRCVGLCYTPTVWSGLVWSGLVWSVFYTQPTLPLTSHQDTRSPGSCQDQPSPASLTRGSTKDMKCELQQFTPMAEPIFVWGSVDTDSFIKSLRSAYAEAVHWRRNCFKVPSGNIGNSFVSELARLYNAFATGSALESVAMEAAMTMPILLLQKPHRTSKMKDHIACLERRLESWKDGDIAYLLEEGRTIQQRLPRNFSSCPEQQLARSFCQPDVQREDSCCVTAPVK